ncbi:MAG: SO_0444 family Cu/Zn efflux transporter [Chitinivibrionia bacterium]|nr:SO_0444 family Cu/Zn efflux transporter [Chitinivibrionia bacterium]
MLTYIAPFIHLFNEMSPYLLFGFLFAGILRVFVPKEKYISHIKKPNFLSVLRASIAGIPLPLCSCGVIPTAVSLNKEGASKGATVAFLTSTPQENIQSIVATYSLFGPAFAIINPLTAFISGITGGVAVNKFDKENPDKKLPSDIENTCKTLSSKPKNKILAALHYGYVEMLQDIGKWLFIGIFIAGLLAVFLPDSLFSDYFNNPFLNMLIVLAIALPSYTCSMAALPVAAVLMSKGLTAGAAFVFLMAGPITSIATMTVVGKTLGKRTLIIYLINIISMSLIIGLTIDYLLPAEWFNISVISANPHCEESRASFNPFNSICSLVLVGLIINAGIQKKLSSKKKPCCCTKES